MPARPLPYSGSLGRMVSCKSGEDFASQANNRIIIQTPTTTPDASGGRSEAWNDTLTLWSVIEPLTGREVYVSSQIQSRVDARITIRYQSTLADNASAAKCRVKY